jgi:hypothetical protein
MPEIAAAKTENRFICRVTPSSELLPAANCTLRSFIDDATQRRRLRNEVKQSRQLQVVLAHAVLVPAFLSS